MWSDQNWPICAHTSKWFLWFICKLVYKIYLEREWPTQREAKELKAHNAGPPHPLSKLNGWYSDVDQQAFNVGYMRERIRRPANPMNVCSYIVPQIRRCPFKLERISPSGKLRFNLAFYYSFWGIPETPSPPPFYCVSVYTPTQIWWRKTQNCFRGIFAIIST